MLPTQDPSPRPPDGSVASLVDGWLRALPPAEPPADLGERVLARYDAAGGRPSWSLLRGTPNWLAGTAAAAVVLVSLGLLLLSREASRVGYSPQDGSSGDAVAVVDDPGVSLFHGIPTFEALDAGEGNGSP
jgi:hypothetical protein